MAIIPTGLLLLAACVLTFTLKDTLLKNEPSFLSWHKLCGCDNFYIVLNLPDKPVTTIDLSIVDNPLKHDVIVSETKLNCFRIIVPKGTSLHELKRTIRNFDTSNKLVASFFNELNGLFNTKEDQDSYNEMFVYLDKVLH